MKIDHGSIYYLEKNSGDQFGDEDAYEDDTKHRNSSVLIQLGSARKVASALSPLFVSVSPGKHSSFHGQADAEAAGNGERGSGNGKGSLPGSPEVAKKAASKAPERAESGWSSSKWSPTSKVLGFRQTTKLKLQASLRLARAISDTLEASMPHTLAEIKNDPNLTETMKASMMEYDDRREQVRAKIEAGAVHTLQDGSSVRLQGDLDLYTYESQLMRSKIKRSPEFRKEAERLWEVVKVDATVGVHVDCRTHGHAGVLEQGGYVTMLRKFGLLIVPRPEAGSKAGKVDRAELDAIALEDWRNDLGWAKELSLVAPGADFLNYEAFFHGLYQLIDMWTSTTMQEEYIEMVRRLIDGVTMAGPPLRFKEDEEIEHDPAFHVPSFHEEAEDPLAQTHADLFEDDEDLDPSDLAEYARKKKAKKSRKSKPGPMKPGTVMKTIAKIYKSKQNADLYANSSESVKPIRLDKFVHRFFIVQSGTKKIANRMLRHFVSSAFHYATQEPAEYPRIFLFCVLTGVVEFKGTDYNPRLAANYFQPALRILFPNPFVIDHVLGDGLDREPRLILQCLQHAVIPADLGKSLGGPFAIRNFKQKMRDMSAASGTGSKRNYMVPFDLTMVNALDLWFFSDQLRLVRERAAIQVLQRATKNYLKRKVEKNADAARGGS
mmetsp:Transcript_65321/g.147370  ORF Transcript_65321/g.147370 Transcript_65321/m.147370 type:complete len:662 (+) Transcript_65321:151-2136(+)